MAGMIYSLFDNPHRYKWEPDRQKVPDGLKVVEFRSEDWPDRGDIASKDVILQERQRELYYRKKDLERLTVRRDQLKKQMINKTDKLTKLQEVTGEIASLRKEIAKYEKNIIKLNGEIIKLERFTITAGHLKELLSEVQDDCIIQVNSKGDELGDWKNCKYTMIRVLIDRDTARRMVPEDKEEKKKLGLS